MMDLSKTPKDVIIHDAKIAVDIIDLEGGIRAKGVVRGKKTVLVNGRFFEPADLAALGLWVRHATHEQQKEFECWVNFYIENNICKPFAFATKFGADKHRRRSEYWQTFAHQTYIKNTAARVRRTDDFTNPAE